MLSLCSELLNTIREAPENKKCFDCTDTTSPRYVCTNFCTFVCSCCANIHKEFGHQIQCLSVFSFSFSEIRLLKETGNKVAAEKWLPRWTPNDMKEPDPTSPTYKENAREYIRAKYFEKRWAKMLPRVDYSTGAMYQLHDDKLGLPTSVATNYHGSNPFLYHYPPSFPVTPASRMSFPPHVGYQFYPHMMADVNPYYHQMAIHNYQRTLDSSQANSNAYINPFDDTPHTNKELLRSRTSTDLIRDRSNSFPPTDSSVIIRSASAQAVICPPDIFPSGAIFGNAKPEVSNQPTATAMGTEEESGVGLAKGKMLGLMGKMAGLLNPAKRSPKMSV